MAVSQLISLTYQLRMLVTTNLIHTTIP